MALRGMATGGCSFALPGEYDDTADLSVFLWARSGGADTMSARLLTLINAERTRGCIVHLGGGVSGSSQVSDVVISAASGVEANWGSSLTQGGRGRAIVSGLSDTVFSPLAFSMRGSGAADNTGHSGAMQLHEVWWKGGLAAIASTSTASALPAEGGKVVLLCREASNLSAFNGWVAEVAVWQGHRLTSAEAARLSHGASPMQIMPEKLLFYRSFRTGLVAEAGDMPLTMISSGVSVDAATHPLFLIESARGVHGMASGSPLLTGGGPGEGEGPGEGGEPGPGEGGDGLAPQDGRLRHRVRAMMLSSLRDRCRDDAWHVPPDQRHMDVGRC